MVRKKSKVPELICEGSVQGLFYDQLQIINASISRPLPIEAIHYSSMVLSKYSENLPDLDAADVGICGK